MSMEWRGGNHIVPVDFRDDHLPEPDDFYEQYSEWLCQQADLHICNGHDLVRHYESATRFDEFLERCRRCGVVGSSLTFDGLCGACDDDLIVAHPDCDDDPLAQERRNPG